MFDRIQANFEQFHRDNPRVYELFNQFTWQLIRRGYEHGSAKMVSERIRWETALDTTSRPPVKLNNNYASRYARLWMQDNPRHAGFFRTRELRRDSLDSVNIPETEQV